MMGGEFVSATINSKGTFLLRCWISKGHCPLIGIFLGCMRLRWLLMLLLLVLFAEFRPGFRELH